MPDQRIKRHAPALMGDVDMSHLGGASVFDLGGFNVSLGAATDKLKFYDMVAFLNGYGSTGGHTLTDHFTIAANAAVPGSSILVTIGPDDKIKVSSANQIRIQPGPDNHLLGFSNTAATQVSNTLNAPNPWKRGIVRWTTGINFTMTGFAGSFTAPAAGYLGTEAQSIPTYIRNRPSANDELNIWDAASPRSNIGQCFEAVIAQTDASAQGFGANITDIKCFVTPRGRVAINYLPNSPGDTDASVIFSNIEARAFWARLGGRGDEIAVAKAGGRYTITTARSAPCVLALDRGYVNFRRTVINRDDFAEMSNGAIVTSGLPPLRQWQATLRVVGPTYGADASLEQHLRDWWPYSRRGITYFPQWFDMDSTEGAIDPRLNYRPRDGYILNGLQQKYATHYTTEGEDDHTVFTKRKGGMLFLRTIGANRKRTEEYREDLDCYQDIKFTLQDDPTRGKIEPSQASYESYLL